MESAQTALPYNDRIKGETPRAYACFCAYRDLGVHRSIVKACNVFYRKECAPRSGKVRNATKWSGQNHWAERVAAFDKDELAKQEESLQVRRIEARERRLKISTRQIAKGLARLREIPEDKLTPDQALKLIEAGMHNERLDLGEPVQRTEVSGPEGEPIDHSTIVIRRVISDDELQELVKGNGDELRGDGKRRRLKSDARARNRIQATDPK